MEHKNYYSCGKDNIYKWERAEKFPALLPKLYRAHSCLWILFSWN